MRSGLRAVLSRRWRAANAAASARFRMRSFSRTCLTWVLTVGSLMTSRSAISRLRRPSASSASTSRSRSLSARQRILRRRLAAAHVGEHAARHRGRDPRLAARDREHGLDQLGRRHVLGQVARRADPQRGVQVRLLLGDREHQHLGAAALSRRRAHASSPSTSGMLRSSSTTSGAPPLGERERLAAVAGEPDDLDPLVGAQQRGGALAHQAVVVGEEHANRHRDRDGSVG